MMSQALRVEPSIALLLRGIALRLHCIALGCIVMPSNAMRRFYFALQLHCQFIGKWAGVGWNGVIETASAEPGLRPPADEESDPLTAIRPTTTQTDPSGPRNRGYADVTPPDLREPGYGVTAVTRAVSLTSTVTSYGRIGGGVDEHAQGPNAGPRAVI
jgi:hypothetical protein